MEHVHRALSAPLSDAPDLCRIGAAELAAAYQSRRISPVEVSDAVLARSHAIQPRFNAFTRILEQTARAEAAASEARWKAGAPLSPVDGIPTTIKDIVYVAGVEITYGSAALPSVIASNDAPAVARLRAAGVVITAITTTPEFGWKALTDSHRYGITRNPFDPRCTPGGSSGGAAVAAACGAGVFHLGTDGGGSIRIPASFTGITGYKPTFGLVPAYPQSAFGTVAHLGPMARTPDDALRMLQAMEGRAARDWLQPSFGELTTATETFQMDRASIGIWRTPPVGMVDPAVAAIFDRVLRVVAASGATLQEIALPDEDLLDLFKVHWYAGAANRMRDVASDQRSQVDPGFAEVAAEGALYSAADYMAAGVRRATFGQGMDRLLVVHDLVLSPATAIPAFGAGLEVPAGSGLARWTEWAGFSFPINLSQQPACVIPVGMTQGGLPVGLQIIGARGQDGKVLAAASTLSALLAQEKD